MRVLLIVFLFLISYPVKSQVKLLTIDELNNRIANGKDTTYVINFWATWCAPCIAELPNFEKIGSENHNKPVKILLVSLDFKSKLQSKVVPFVEQNKIKGEIFLLKESNQQAYIGQIDRKWSGAIPATLFVSKKARKFYEKEFTEAELKKTLIGMK